MTTLAIHIPNQEEVIDVSVTKDAKIFRQLGGEYYVELSVNSTEYLSFPRGSYIEPEGISSSQFFLKNDATPEPIPGVDGYKYVLKFYAPQHHLESCQIKWLTYGKGNVITKRELTFTLTTSLLEYAKLIAANMNDYLDVTDKWVVADDLSKEDADYKELSFDGVSCWDAIGDIAKAFGVEWWVDHGEKLTIHFGKCEVGDDPVPIREGEIVNRFPAPKRGDDSNYGTRFYIYGGVQNIPANYEGSNAGTDVNHISERRLRPRQLPNEYSPYIDYYDVVDNLKPSEIIEKTIILDDIFPEGKMTINDELKEEERTINGKDSEPIYLIKVPEKPDIIGQLGITFTSGALMNRSFSAKYQLYKDVLGEGETVNSHWIEILYEIEGSAGSEQIVVPNKYLMPQKGDTYILTGVNLGKTAIRQAEARLYKKGTELANQYYSDTNVYDCPVNPIFCENEEIDFEIGAKVNLIGAQFGEGRISRIQGYEKKLYNPYIATYNIGDNRKYSRWNVLETDFILAQAAAEKKQEQKEQTLKIQALSESSSQQLQALKIEVDKLKGTEGDTKDSESILGAKLYTDNAVVKLETSTGQKLSALTENIGSGAISPTRLMIGGTQCTKHPTTGATLIGFNIQPSVQYQNKFNTGANKLVELTDANADKNKGVCVFVDEKYDGLESSVDMPRLGLSLDENDMLISDGTKWRKLTRTSIEGHTGEISKAKLVSLLVTGTVNDTAEFEPLATQAQVTDHEDRITKVERRVTIAVVTPKDNSNN